MTVNVNTSPPDFIKSTTCLWVAPSTFTLFLQRDHALSSGRRRNIHEYIRIHLFIPITDRFVSRVKIRSAPFTIVHPLVLHSGHVTRQHLLLFFFLSRVCERERERGKKGKLSIKWSLIGRCHAPSLSGRNIIIYFSVGQYQLSRRENDKKEEENRWTALVELRIPRVKGRLLLATSGRHGSRLDSRSAPRQALTCTLYLSLSVSTVSPSTFIALSLIS